MTQKEGLRTILAQKMSKEEIMELSQTINYNSWESIFSFISEEDKELSANAAHTLLKAKGKIEIWLAGKTTSIIEIIKTTCNLKTKRLLLSILEKQKIDNINIDTTFLDYCINNIVSLGTPLAIKVLCIKLAYKQSTAYPELLYELKNLLEIMDDNMLNPSLLCAKKNTLRAINTTLASCYRQGKEPIQ